MSVEIIKTILDAKGTVIHMYHRGSDLHPVHFGEEGETVASASHCVRNWIEGVLLPTLERSAPQDVIAAWDGGNLYRETLYSKYKLHRRGEKTEFQLEEANQQEIAQKTIKLLLAHLGAVNVFVSGVEADDVIALLCEGLKNEKKYIQTGDEDLIQLVNDNTVVLLKEKVILGEHKGVPPHLVVLHKSLVGDSSDGYPGVKGFGPAAWKDLEEVYGRDGLEEIDQCMVNKDYTLIEECVEQDGNKHLSKALDDLKSWKMCYNLATLHPEICYDTRGRRVIRPQWFTKIPDNGSKIRRILESVGGMEFYSSLETHLRTETLVTADNLEAAFDALNEELPNSPLVSFDYETTDTLKHAPFTEALSAMQRSRGGYVDVLSQVINGVSFNFGRNNQHTLYLSTDHKDTNNVDQEVICDVLKEVLYEVKVPMAAHNFSFEEQVTKQCLGMELPPMADTKILASYADEETQAGLKSLSFDYLGYTQTTYKELLESAGVDDMSQMSGEQVLSYGCDDSVITSHLHKLFTLICKIEGTLEFVEGQEYPTVLPLNRRFEAGMAVDYEVMSKLQEEDRTVVEESEVRLRELLLDNCCQVNKKAAEDYIASEFRSLKKLKELDGKKLRREEELLRYENKSEYIPYFKEESSLEFTGTAGQLKKIALLVGFPEDIQMQSVAKTKINLWLTEIKEWDWKEAIELDRLAQAGEFLTLLAESAHQVAKKEGEEFEELKKFCSGFMDKKTKTVGDALNLNSPAQMQELLYLKLGFSVSMRTMPQRGSRRDELGLPGSPGTDEDSMKFLVAEQTEEGDWRREVVSLVIASKASSTRESLYWKPYPKWKHPRDGMIHPGINCPATKTRRPKGTSPNILQVSKGPTRSFVIPRYTKDVIVALDFSGQELRITGSESKDSELISAYTAGGSYIDEDGMERQILKDIHSVTACSFASKIIEQSVGKEAMASLPVTNGGLDYQFFISVLEGDEQVIANSGILADELSRLIYLCRKMAKVVNFLIIYGGGPTTLAKDLGVTVKFAEQLMEAVFNSYKMLAPWQERVIRFARDNGFVKTAYGNWKHLTDSILSRDSGLRGHAERQAVNQTIQGCAADILKVVLSGCQKTKLFEETGATFYAPVYDEILASVPIDNLFEYCERMQTLMNITPPGHAIPMMAEVSVGPSWFPMTELGDRPSEKKLIACVDSFTK